MTDHETSASSAHRSSTAWATGFEELFGRTPPHARRARRHPRRREWSGCESRRLTRLLKLAKIGQDACLEGIRCEPGRGLDKAVLGHLGLAPEVTV